MAGTSPAMTEGGGRDKPGHDESGEGPAVTDAVGAGHDGGENGACWTPLARASDLKPALLNQPRLDRGDACLAFAQGIGAGVHGVIAEDEVVVVAHGRAEDELRIR